MALFRSLRGPSLPDDDYGGPAPSRLVRGADNTAVTTHRHDRRRRRARTASVQVNWFYRFVRCVFFFLLNRFSVVFAVLIFRSVCRVACAGVRNRSAVDIFRSICVVQHNDESQVNETAAAVHYCYYILQHRSPVVVGEAFYFSSALL